MPNIRVSKFGATDDSSECVEPVWIQTAHRSVPACRLEKERGDQCIIKRKDARTIFKANPPKFIQPLHQWTTGDSRPESSFSNGYIKIAYSRQSR